MKSLPDNVEAYKQTPEFTHDTVPVGLMRDHATKSGVWGLIRVTVGQLRYEIAESEEAIELGPGDLRGVIEPEIKHRVTPIGDVRFFIEFYRAPA